MSLNRDEIQALAETQYDQDMYQSPEESVFALLVDVAGAYYEMMNNTPVSFDDPDSFKPQTFAGVSTGWACIQGLIENLEMNYPDGDFRRMLPGQDGC